MCLKPYSCPGSQIWSPTPLPYVPVRILWCLAKHLPRYTPQGYLPPPAGNSYSARSARHFPHTGVLPRSFQAGNKIPQPSRLPDQRQWMVRSVHTDSKLSLHARNPLLNICVSPQAADNPFCAYFFILPNNSKISKSVMSPPAAA